MSASLEEELLPPGLGEVANYFTLVDEERISELGVGSQA
jgi:hypothetical protein